MLLKPTQHTRASSEIIAQVVLANLISTATPRTVTAVTVTVIPNPAPPTPGSVLRADGGWDVVDVSPDLIAYSLQGGGFITGRPDGGELQIPVQSSTIITGSTDHQLVRVTFRSTRTYTDTNSDTWVEVQNSSAGDGITPFPQTNFNNQTEIGIYHVVYELLYDSGLIESVEYNYFIPGVVVAPPPPPPPPPDEEIAFSALPGGAIQALQDAKTVIAQTSTAFQNTIGAAEAWYLSSPQTPADSINAVIMENNSIAAIGLQWEAIANNPAVPLKLKVVAAQNATWVFQNLLELNFQGHNGNPSLLAVVDANFVKYKNYGTYAWAQSAETIVSIGAWL